MNNKELDPFRVFEIVANVGKTRQNSPNGDISAARQAGEVLDNPEAVRLSVVEVPTNVIEEIVELISCYR